MKDDPIQEYFYNNIHGGCRRRVWDSGDGTNCGDPIVRSDLCEKHLGEVISKIRSDAQSTRERLEALEAALERLNA